MRNDLFLKSDVAKNLYDAVRDLPIVDYHCHLSPKEILEDREFPDIAQIWLGGDHYKWRLMRACGVPEALITGDAEPREKFRAWAACLETAMGNPLYVWSHMELSMFFGIEDTLTAESADDIFDRANAYIKERHLSPRKLMLQSHVELVATTDDPADSLEYHKEIAKEKNFPVRVVPSFRTDAALNICRANYRDYALHLGEVCGFSVETLDDLKTALSKRLDFFCENGCRVSDIGIEGFPKEDKSCDAAETFKKALKGKTIPENEFRNFLFEMYVYLAHEYKAHNVTMQLHLNVKRARGCLRPWVRTPAAIAWATRSRSTKLQRFWTRWTAGIRCRTQSYTRWSLRCIWRSRRRRAVLKALCPAQRGGSVTTSAAWRSS